jgi:sugar lactone lactonase YvrE
MFGKAWVDNAGTLYSLDASMTLTPRLPGVTISNGLVWIGDRFHYIDTPTLRVDTYPYDGATGALGPALSPAAVLTDKRHGFPDGMVQDTDGNLWVACFNVGGAPTSRVWASVRRVGCLWPRAHACGYAWGAIARRLLLCLL